MALRNYSGQSTAESLIAEEEARKLDVNKEVNSLSKAADERDLMSESEFNAKELCLICSPIVFEVKPESFMWLTACWVMEP